MLTNATINSYLVLTAEFSRKKKYSLTQLCMGIRVLSWGTAPKFHFRFPPCILILGGESQAGLRGQDYGKFLT